MSFDATLIAASVKLAPISLPPCSLSPDSPTSFVPNSWGILHIVHYNFGLKTNSPRGKPLLIPPCIFPWYLTCKTMPMDSQPMN